MNQNQKSTFRLLALLMLLSLVMVVGCLIYAPSREPTMQFIARSASSAIELEPYYSSQDNTYYLFVPFRPDQCQLTFNSEDVQLVVDDKPLSKGAPLSLRADVPRPMAIGRGQSVDSSRLCVKYIADVPTMDVRLSNKVLQRIDRDREYIGYATMNLYSPEGKLQEGWHTRNVTLKGRGNSTWWNPKKPFLLNLDRADTLLGMAEGQKWVLLANAFDFSNLRNKIVLDFAGGLGMQWNPSGRFVNLFFNGQYYGLYLLTEKIELSETRLNPERVPTYLFLNDIEETVRKAGKPSYPFTGDQYVGVMEARSAGDVPLDSIKEGLEQFRRILLSPKHPTDSELASVMDIESWACKYLTDELFLNGDVWRRSNFFYSLGYAPYKFYSGPVWDYDLAMASTHEEILAESDHLMPIYTMCQSKAFQHVSDSIYYHYGRPYAVWLLDHGLDSLAQTIEQSATANAIRWRHDDALQTTSTSAVDTLKRFFQQRIRLLDNYFSRTQPMQFVTLESTDPGLKGFYSTVLYHQGSKVSDYLAITVDSNNDNSWMWVDSTDGHYYTLDSVPPPGCRLNIVSSTGDQATDTQDTFQLRKWLMRIVIFIFFSISFFCIVVYEIRKYKRT